MSAKQQAVKKGGKPKREDLRSRLSAEGYSFTRQRTAVFEYLQQAEHHPTAEEVFLAIKKTLPKVSLATVYKNLEALIEAGVASKLTYGDGSARYDIRTDHHYHLRCLQCGKIWDMEPTEMSEAFKRMKPRPGFQVRDLRLELLGTCRECRKE
jgi:Fe2+ or Zn2+ uptake regulation protein